MAERVLWAVENMSLQIGRQILFDKAAMSISDGERVALVGRNGCGKSTLLKIVAGEETPSSGEISVARNIRIAHMPQNFEPEPDRSVKEVVREGLSWFENLHQRYESLPAESPEHEKLEHLLSCHNAWNLDNKLDTILDKLSISNPERSCSGLSGGELRRVILARTIIAEPDLLLLDEPTNHLDVDTIAGIEEFLANYRGACLFVTHDRYFLDRIASRIIELDNGKFFSCEGSYADFLIAKEEREYAEDQAENRRRSFLRREIEWVRRSPKARLRRNLGRLKRYDEIASQNAPVRTGRMELVIPRASHLGNKVVDLKEISFSRGERCLIRDFSFEFTANQKIGVVGVNGCGKTTLLKLITQQLQPDAGEVFVAPTVEFNYVDQSRIALNPEHTVCEEIGEGHTFINLGEERISIWGYLKRFLFEDERINTQIKHLSGGEKARLMLAKILRGGGNFLILDEPTNDLDLVSLRILEEALADYNGCLIVVSHDRYFLNRICTHIIAFEGNNGSLFATVGDFDYYQTKKKERMTAEQENKRREEVKTAPPPPVRRNTPRKLSFKEERELESLEQTIAETEERIAEIEAMFSDPDFFARHGKQTAELQRELEERKHSLENAYTRWEELESKKESFQ